MGKQLSILLAERINTNFGDDIQAFSESSPSPLELKNKIIVTVASATDSIVSDNRDKLREGFLFLVSSKRKESLDKAQEIFDFFIPSNNQQGGMFEESDYCFFRPDFISKPRLISSVGNFFTSRFELSFLIAK